jgi:site-specific DNA-methyltransferase (adenine-specific)
MSNYKLLHGSNLEVLPTLPDNYVDAIVTDPPYELGFMGKAWDSTGIAYSVKLWSECLRVLKPGGHLLAFSGSRTYHRMTCAIEDAGFEIRDQIMWVYGSGFPKSHNVSKALDKAAGVEPQVLTRNPNSRENSKKENNLYDAGTVGKTAMITAPSSDAAKQWDGWGTALKPAHEPICLARKPLEGTVASNVTKWGVGGININACRVGNEGGCAGAGAGARVFGNGLNGTFAKPVPGLGRFPANLMHDGSQQVLDLFPSNAGSAARFFYCPKASKADRDNGCGGFDLKRDSDRKKTDGVGGDNPRNRTNKLRSNFHPTVKPTELMRYLCRLITPPKGLILDPFNGSGSTGKAALLEGFSYLGIELNLDYIKISEARLNDLNT